MNRPVWKWLLVISLSLNIGILASVGWRVVQGKAALSTSAASHKTVHLPEYLNLSEEQRRQWHDGEQAFLNDLSANWHAIRAHRETLVRQIFSAGPDRSLINKEQVAIARLQDAQQRRVIDQLLAERDMLDESQRAALMRLLLDRYTQESTEEEALHRK